MMSRSAGVMTSSVLSLALLAGCSEGEAERMTDRAVDRAVDRAGEEVREGVGGLPEVDWAKHGLELKRRVDRLAGEADCPRLKRLAQREGGDSEVSRYIEAQLRRAC